MRRATLTFTLGAALSVLAVSSAAAMGFGRTAVATSLGQPLNFFANVALDVDESLARECVGAEVMIGDSHVARENIRVTLESAREPGERRVRVTTRSIVDEPIVTVDVTVGCNSRMSKRFVAFIDPPMLHLASVDDESAPQRVDNQVQPLLEIVRAADASRARVPAARGDAGDSDSTRPARRVAPGRQLAAGPSSARATPLRVAQATRTRAPARSEVGTGGVAAAVRSVPRLRLDAAPALASMAPPGMAGAGPASAPTAGIAPDVAMEQIVAAQASAAAASAALGREQERMQALEAGLARLRSDSQAQQKTLFALQARLKEAESERYANGLVYALAGGMLFFALLAAALYAVRPRQRRGARWFDGAPAQRRAAAAAAVARPSVAAETASAAAHAPAISQHPSQWNEGPSSILPVTAPATIGGLEVTTVLAPQTHYARMAEAGASANSGAPAARPRSASPSMEDLIDLEQQAEFFVVLGQDEAAIALLTAYLDEAGGGSPLPYLQLLEIHQRRDDRDSYEEVRRAFHKHFGAYAPEWSSDLHFGRALEEYPQAIARLQALWPTPLHAMQSLDGLLFRRSEGDETFDFPAYRELLFLYSIARELAGNVETDAGSIDLFLPLDDTPTEPNLRPEQDFSIDLDVSSWSEDAPAENLVIRRSAGRRSAS